MSNLVMHPGVQLQSQTSSNRPPTAASKHPSAAAAHSGQPPPRRRSTAGGCTRCATCSSSCPSQCSAARARTLNWCRRRATRCGCASTLGSGASVVPRLSFYLCHNVWFHRIKIGFGDWGSRLGGPVVLQLTPEPMGASSCASDFYVYSVTVYSLATDVDNAAAFQVLKC